MRLVAGCGGDAGGGEGGLKSRKQRVETGGEGLRGGYLPSLCSSDTPSGVACRDHGILLRSSGTEQQGGRGQEGAGGGVNSGFSLAGFYLKRQEAPETAQSSR